MLSIIGLVQNKVQAAAFIDFACTEMVLPLRLYSRKSTNRCVGGYEIVYKNPEYRIERQLKEWLVGFNGAIQRM